MSLKVTFELSPRDLRYFRQRLKQVRGRGREVDEARLLATCNKLIHEIRHYSRATDFLLVRLERLSKLVDMLADEQWSMSGRDRLRVIEGLTYFAEGEDLIPDRIPGLGYLDDAIMIELIVDDLRHEIEAYDDFVAFRKAHGHAPAPRRGAGARIRGLEPRRDQLLSRMRRRIRRDQARRKASGTPTGTVL